MTFVTTRSFVITRRSVTTRSFVTTLVRVRPPRVSTIVRACPGTVTRLLWPGRRYGQQLHSRAQDRGGGVSRDDSHSSHDGALAAACVRNYAFDRQGLHKRVVRPPDSEAGLTSPLNPVAAKKPARTTSTPLQHCQRRLSLKRASTPVLADHRETPLLDGIHTVAPDSRAAPQEYCVFLLTGGNRIVTACRDSSLGPSRPRAQIEPRLDRRTTHTRRSVDPARVAARFA